jgi:hypothetical protein
VVPESPRGADARASCPLKELARLMVDFTIRKEILWESDSASDTGVRRLEVEFVRKLRSNDPDHRIQPSGRDSPLRAAHCLPSRALSGPPALSSMMPVAPPHVCGCRIFASGQPTLRLAHSRALAMSGLLSALAAAC